MIRYRPRFQIKEKGERVKIYVDGKREPYVIILEKNRR